MKAIPNFTRQMEPGNLAENLYEASVLLEHHFGEPYLDLNLFCINRKKSNGLYREGLIIDEGELLPEIDLDDIKLIIDQKFTIQEVIVLYGIFQIIFNTQIVIEPVIFPIEFQSPFNESFTNSFDVYYFDEFMIFNLDFEVVGVGERK